MVVGGGRWKEGGGGDGGRGAGESGVVDLWRVGERERERERRREER